jgi:hypothetical protein
MGIPPHSSGDGGRAGGPGRTFYALQQALEGRYALEEELGRGGMGIVYLAWERELDRMVALKLLSPARTAPRQRERFLREARAAARLSHPNIVPIYTVDQVGPFVYYTMAYIEGETLDQRVKAGGAGAHQAGGGFRGPTRAAAGAAGGDLRPAAPRGRRQGRCAEPYGGPRGGAGRVRFARGDDRRARVAGVTGAIGRILPSEE